MLYGCIIMTRLGEMGVHRPEKLDRAWTKIAVLSAVLVISFLLRLAAMLWVIAKLGCDGDAEKCSETWLVAYFIFAVCDKAGLFVEIGWCYFRALFNNFPQYNNISVLSKQIPESLPDLVIVATIAPTGSFFSLDRCIKAQDKSPPAEALIAPVQSPPIEESLEEIVA